MPSVITLDGHRPTLADPGAPLIPLPSLGSVSRLMLIPLGAGFIVGLFVGATFGKEQGKREMFRKYHCRYRL